MAKTRKTKAEARKPEDDKAAEQCACRNEETMECRNIDGDNCGKKCIWMGPLAKHCLDRVPFDLDAGLSADASKPVPPGEQCIFFTSRQTCANNSIPDFYEGPCQFGGRIGARCLDTAMLGRKAADEAAVTTPPIVDVPASSPPAAGQLQVIAVSEIHPSPFQLRAIAGTPELDAELAGLAESIRNTGLANPLTVRWAVVKGPLGTSPGEWELVAGHRRLAAAKLAGLAEVPCYVLEMDDRAAEDMLVCENLQRRDLTAIEEADSVARMMRTCRSVESVAKATGKSTRWVYRRASLAKLTPQWREFALAQNLSAAFLQEMARLPVEMQRRLYDDFCCHGILAGTCNDWNGKWCDAGGDIETLQLKVERNTRNLSTTPWMELCPQFCEGCVKRSDRQLDLFDAADFEGEARCLDSQCWAKKLEGWIAKDGPAAVKAKYGKCEIVPENMRYRVEFAAAKKRGYSTPAIIGGGHEGGSVVWLRDKGKGAETEDEAPSRGPTPEQKADAQWIRTVEQFVSGMSEPRFEQMEEFSGPYLTRTELLVMGLAVGLRTASWAPKGINSWTTVDRLTKACAFFAGHGESELEQALWTALRPEILSTLRIDTVSNCGMQRKWADQWLDLLHISPEAVEAVLGGAGKKTAVGKGKKAAAKKGR